MTKNQKLTLGIVAVACIALFVAVLLTNDDEPPAPSTEAEAADLLVRPDSQRLSEAEDGKVTFVEFLDFECEACRAAFPAVEALREEYGDRMTFVVRYLPLHTNSVPAAQAAEAAAAQGRFEDMYRRLFETQSEWGEQTSSQEDFFFGLAEELGLDMQQFREVYEAPETLARIEQSASDAQALGATGTPTFFLNGERLQVSSLDELTQQIDEALAG